MCRQLARCSKALNSSAQRDTVSSSETELINHKQPQPQPQPHPQFYIILYTREAGVAPQLRPAQYRCVIRNSVAGPKSSSAPSYSTTTTTTNQGWRSHNFPRQSKAQSRRDSTGLGYSTANWTDPSALLRSMITLCDSLHIISPRQWWT